MSDDITTHVFYPRVTRELARAKARHPDWPTDPIHAAAIVTGASGGLARAANDFYYGNGPTDSMTMKAVQVVVTALRFLEEFAEYDSQYVALRNKRMAAE